MVASEVDVPLPVQKPRVEDLLNESSILHYQIVPLGSHRAGIDALHLLVMQALRIVLVLDRLHEIPQEEDRARVLGRLKKFSRHLRSSIASSK